MLDVKAFFDTRNNSGIIEAASARCILHNFEWEDGKRTRVACEFKWELVSGYGAVK